MMSPLKRTGMMALALIASTVIRCDCDGRDQQCDQAIDCEGRPWGNPNCTREEGHWECTLNFCVEVCDDACQGPADCSGRPWPTDVGCSEAEGRWTCPDGDCVAVCEPDECSRPADCEVLTWPVDVGCDETEGRWECDAGSCVAVCEPDECAVPTDCDALGWPAEAGCEEADGHWECDAGTCVAICDVECVDYTDCEGRLWPVEVVDCLEEEGHWECVAGTCEPVCNAECDVDAHCGAFEWPEACGGQWDCVQGLCEAVCDAVGCGDGTCDAAAGETDDACPDDCALECAAPVDCVDVAEWDLPCGGRWSCEARACVSTCDYTTCGDDSCDEAAGEDAATCPPDCRSGCQWPYECTHLEWTKICQGRFTCFLGDCQQTCDSNGCGNDTCDDELGETADSCFKDCLGGPCDEAVDCTGYRWYDQQCAEGGRWSCVQPAGACEAVCDPETCGDGTCDVLGGEAATSCPADCQEWDCDLSEHCDGLPLPTGCNGWLCVERNCRPVCP